MRLTVKKTYKLYIGGQFPRTESEHYYPVHSPKGDVLLANVCKGSRKDARNAVVAARNAFDGWSKKTALNRGQILYRTAEIIEARAGELVNELEQMGSPRAQAEKEVAASIDCLVYYAGWSDKYAHILGSVNPVAGSFYNFSLPEPTGVVVIVAPETPSLFGLVARLAPAIVAGNTVVAITSEKFPLAALTLGEILQNGDVPGGVVNLISGPKTAIVPWLAKHMDVNAIDLSGVDDKDRVALEQGAAENVKRVVGRPGDADPAAQSLWTIASYLEIKTVWHPMGV